MCTQTHVEPLSIPDHGPELAAGAADALLKGNGRPDSESAIVFVEPQAPQIESVALKRENDIKTRTLSKKGHLQLRGIKEE